jgi:hypothetical protein
MSKLPISNLVDLTINLIGAAQSVDGFGVPLIVDTENVKGAAAGVPILTTCYSLQDLLDAGYTTHSKAYVLALHLLSYSNKRVKRYIVASVNSLSSAELTAVESANSGWYALLVTSRASADIQICATWTETVASRRHFYFGETQDTAAFSTGPSILTILENAGRLRTGIVARKVNAQTLTLTISDAFVAANSITVKVNGTTVGPVVFAVDSNNTLGLLATALAATAAIDTATTAGGVGSGNRTITITAADPLVPVEVTAYVCSLGASQNTAAIVETNAGAGAADAELAGLLIPQGLGQSTAAGKTLSGLVADDLTPAEYNNATSHGASCYVTYGVISQIQTGQTSGFVAPGAHAFMDTIFVRDRLESDIQNAVLAVLAPQVGKLPFNNNGISAVAGAAIAVCNQFVTRGMLEPFNVGTDWTIPDISEILPADKTARNLPGITANLTGTGAIQSVEMTVNITV